MKNIKKDSRSKSNLEQTRIWMNYNNLEQTRIWMNYNNLEQNKNIDELQQFGAEQEYG